MSRLKGIAGLSAALMVAAPVLLTVPATGWAQIDEIVVTTRKREESLQDVPLSITALTGETIQRLGIKSLGDVVKLSPSVQFDNSFGPADTRITVRGLSNTRGRSNVAFLVDGIDVTTENLVTAGSGLLANRRLLNDVERIEIVKGPQSALYGRAAFAGAISYISKEPGTEIEGSLSVDVAEDDQRRFDFSYGGPVKGMEDVLGARVSGVFWDEAGRFTNSISGNEVGGSDGFGAALTTVWTPTDELKIKGRVEYTDENYQPRAVARVGGGLPEELLPTSDGSQDNTWPFVINPDNTRTTLDANNDGFPDVNLSDYTCPQGSEFKLYPKSALDADFGVGQSFAFSSLGLADFGPGFCLPSSFGSADNLTIAQSEDPFTGQDYAGTDQQTFRASMQVSFDTGVGQISSYTGYTDFRSFDTYDQDYQAVSRPDTLLGLQNSRTLNETEQFSQEIRFTSDFDSPLNFSLGGFFWKEDRRLTDQNYIAFCSQVAKVPGPNGVKYGVPRAGPLEEAVCNGQNGTLATAQELARELPVSAATNAANGLPPIDDPYIAGTIWDADTDHWSFYINFEWQITDSVKMSFEDRFVWETFSLRKPAKSSCTNAAFAGGPQSTWSAVDGNGQELVCESERLLNPALNPVQPGVSDSWQYIQGSQDSNFQTPKITLEWAPTDDALIYFFWATAQKPGGISQVTGGGFAETIEDGRFDAEKLQAWEFGTKTSWEAAGYLQVNFSGFFQDYTDKQIGTQVLVDDVLSPRIINAGGAEILGIELDAVWQPSFLEGLTLTGAYTWLSAEYTEYFFESASLQRSAQNGECNVVTIAEGTADESLTCRYDFAGNKLERTPEHALVLTGNFTRQFFAQDFDWFVEANGSYQDERFAEDNNFIVFDSYWLVDARLGLEGEKWDAVFYAENLLDNDTLLTGGSGPDFGDQVTYTGFTAGFGISHFFGTLPRPRTIGLRASYRF